MLTKPFVYGLVTFALALPSVWVAAEVNLTSFQVGTVIKAND